MFWRPFYLFCLSLSLSLLLGALGACQPLATQTEAVVTEAPGEAATTATRPFPADSLYSLLVAEVAGQRKQMDVALREYRQQAVSTRDLAVVKRATLIAQYVEDREAVLELARLWGELEPGNSEAGTLVASQLVALGRLDEAFDQSLQLMAQGQRSFFEAIAFQASQQNPDSQSREIQSRLLDRFRQALVQYPDNSELLTGEALLLNALGDRERALQSAQQALDANPDNTAAAVFAASLLQQEGDKQGAARLIRQRVKAEPKNQRLRLQYARLLVELDLKEAQHQFQILVNEAPMDADLILALALVSKELGDYARATEYLEQLLFIQRHVSTAYFNLAQISELQHNIPRAIELYHRVDQAHASGKDFLFASAAICRLAGEQGDMARCQDYLREQRQLLVNSKREDKDDLLLRLYLIEADALHHQSQLAAELAVLNEGLDKFPQQADLLYARSLLYDRANNLKAAEADLRAILQKEPDNGNALNALGYTLVNKTDRLQEGYELITRALALDPDNGAVLDSMGWALYRMNRTEESLVYLQKAMAAFPNHEVAAHLGEVLWINGEQRQARKIWQQGLEDDPDSDIIRDTMQRLGAD